MYTSLKQRTSGIKTLIMVLGIFIVINLLFGSALTGDFKLLKQGAAPARPGIGTGPVSSGTQLENGGTESGQIRLIVWQGAWEIFKHYPLFGSGVETFAYSYYNFRPQTHNLVSEWDFLYNKAHNEYLNYLATTGLFGLGTYLLFIGMFIIFVLRHTLMDTDKQTSADEKLFLVTILGGYLAYLVQNVFGFSVVMIALLFYLFPAFAFVYSEKTTDFKLLTFQSYDRYAKNQKAASFIIKFLLCFIIFAFLVVWEFGMYTRWKADTFYKAGSDYTDSGSAGKAYSYLLEAKDWNNDEPLYKADLGFAEGMSAVALSDEATTSAALTNQAQKHTEEALQISPKNTSLWRTAIRTYYELSTLNSSFNQKTIDAVDSAIALAPTDPKLYYNKGLILDQFGQTEAAEQALGEAIKLKPNYREAYFTLGEVYQKAGQKDLAIQQFQRVLQLVPNDPDALSALRQLGAK